VKREKGRVKSEKQGSGLRNDIRILSEFEKLDIKYFIGGSLASSLYGIPRATQDVDIIAEIKNEHITLLIKTLE
jgi:hypothetical protein